VRWGEATALPVKRLDMMRRRLEVVRTAIDLPGMLKLAPMVTQVVTRWWPTYQGPLSGGYSPSGYQEHFLRRAKVNQHRVTTVKSLVSNGPPLRVRIGMAEDWPSGAPRQGAGSAVLVGRTDPIRR